MTRLIADSGSTKTTWCWVDASNQAPVVLKPVQTQGLNPLYASTEDIVAAVRQVVAQVGDDCPDLVQFYGAGCSGERIGQVEQALRRVFSLSTRIEVASDVLGACRALFPASGQDGLPAEGIACILGTGAIAARYDARTDKFQAAPSLGYILGDEGSGAWLGRRVLSDYLKQQMPKSARTLFEADYGTGVITAEKVIEHVYKQPFPNRYLASFAVFVGMHADHSYCQQLAFEGIEAFFRRNVKVLRPEEGTPISFVGSVAWRLRDTLLAVAELNGLKLTRVLKEPMEGLVKV
ncbi:MAG: ATPase [Bacteroidales bacterium]|nr:ATPase [Bacteroidales bacterium]